MSQVQVNESKKETTAPVVQVRNISKAFGPVQAVNNVSFDVYEGEILGVIGPNGCGKSTLFNCILGQLKPDTGTVSFKETDISGWTPSRLALGGLGRTFQLLQVFPSMTVRENLLAAAQAHTGSVITRLFMSPDLGLMPEIDKMIEAFRLGHLADEEAGNLSYGQQKLLDIAMSLMSGSGVVFLDEPAGGVNLSMLSGVKDLLIELNQERQATIVVIEHNMEFIFEIAHRIVVMSEGSVLMIGTPDEVRSDPRVIEAYLGH